MLKKTEKVTKIGQSKGTITGNIGHNIQNEDKWSKNISHHRKLNRCATRIPQKKRG